RSCTTSLHDALPIALSYTTTDVCVPLGELTTFLITSRFPFRWSTHLSWDLTCTSLPPQVKITLASTFNVSRAGDHLAVCTRGARSEEHTSELQSREK